MVCFLLCSILNQIPHYAVCRRRLLWTYLPVGCSGVNAGISPRQSQHILVRPRSTCCSKSGAGCSTNIQRSSHPSSGHASWWPHLLPPSIAGAWEHLSLVACPTTVSASRSPHARNTATCRFSVSSSPICRSGAGFPARLIPHARFAHQQRLRPV